MIEKEIFKNIATWKVIAYISVNTAVGCYYGSFANLSLGRVTWYATRRDKPVLIRTTNYKKIIVSPNEVKAFIAELQN